MSLALPPGAVPVAQEVARTEEEQTAEEVEETKRPNGEDVARVVEALSSANPLLDRLGALEEQASSDAEEMRRLSTLVAEQQKTLAASTEMMQALARSIGQGEDHRRRTEEAIERARGELEGASPELAERLDEALETLSSGRWTDENDKTDMEERLAKVEKTLRSAEKEIRRERKALEKRISTSCKDEKVSDETVRRLSPHVEGKVPTRWSADLAMLATEHGVALPECFTELDEHGKALEEEVRKLKKDIKAIKSTVDALGMVIVLASAVINPFLGGTMAVILLLRKLFSKKGGGGDGEGKAAGKGKGESPDESAAGRTKSRKVKEERRKPESADRAGRETMRSGPPKAPGTTKWRPHLHRNVAEGVGAIVEVRGQNIQIIDEVSGEIWHGTWPPRVEGGEGQIPEFTIEAKIIEASVSNKTMTVEMYIEACEGLPVAQLEIGVDPARAEEGGLLVTEVPEECVL